MKFSKIAYKSESYIRNLIKKFNIKIERLESLEPTFYDFDIEMIDIQRNMITEKIREYRVLKQDLSRFYHWKFKTDRKEFLIMYNIEFSIEEVEKLRKYIKREKIINKLI